MNIVRYAFVFAQNIPNHNFDVFYSSRGNPALPELNAGETFFEVCKKGEYRVIGKVINDEGARREVAYKREVSSMIPWRCGCDGEYVVPVDKCKKLNCLKAIHEFETAVETDRKFLVTENYLGEKTFIPKVDAEDTGEAKKERRADNVEVLKNIEMLNYENIMEPKIQKKVYEETFGEEGDDIFTRENAEQNFMKVVFPENDDFIKHSVVAEYSGSSRVVVAGPTEAGNTVTIPCPRQNLAGAIEDSLVQDQVKLASTEESIHNAVSSTGLHRRE